MKDVVSQLIFDLICSALSADGRDELFGKRLDIDRELFANGFAGDEFPILWFELPLSGDPWYDLHVLTQKSALSPDSKIPEGIFYPKLFEWFAKRDGVRQLAMSFDISKGDYYNPAAQLLVSGDDPSVGCDFLEEAGNIPARNAYRVFAGRLPDGWFACYLGTFPGRSDLNLRVECIPDQQLQVAYSKDPALLRRDLGQCGFAISDEMLEFVRTMSDQPVQIEFQFNVGPDGMAEPTLGVSLRFVAPVGNHSHLAFLEENENVVSLMGALEDAGLCDDRWRKLPGCAFIKRLSAGGVSVRFGGYTAFIKVRMTPDRLIDAKTYIFASML